MRSFKEKIKNLTKKILSRETPRDIYGYELKVGSPIYLDSHEEIRYGIVDILCEGGWAYVCFDDNTLFPERVKCSHLTSMPEVHF